MKKIAALMLVAIMLTGCDDIEVRPTYEPVVSSTPERFNLVEDGETGILYISNRTYENYYIYTPYYSENGKLCRYCDGKIVEVGE